MVQQLTAADAQDETARGPSLRDIATSYANSPAILFCVRVGDVMRFGPVSAAFLQATGLAEHQVVGRPVREVIPEPSCTMVLGKYAEAIRTRRAVSWEETSTYPTGTKQGEVTVVPVFDGAGVCTHLAGVVRDATERKRGEDEQLSSAARLELLAHASPVVLYTCTGEEAPFTATFVGANVKEHFGYDAREFVADPHFWADRIHPDDAPRVFSDVKRLFERGSHVFEYRFRVADGSYRWVHDALRLVRDRSGRVVEIIGYWVDISARKYAEEALRLSEQRKDEFLAVLSHELRNPLAAIRSAAQVLERIASHDHPCRSALDVIDRQGEQLTRLVDDLLDVTRISRGKILLQREPVDLSSVVRHAVDDHHAALARFELVVQLPEESIWVDGDPVRLAQIVGNLLSNAAKFTPEGGTVRVTLSRREEGARIEVADTGIGMERDILERVFEPFAQGERTLERTRGGLGLGLALVKGLAEQHGGQVRAYSEGPGRGARFTVDLPLARAGERPTAQGPAAAPAKEARAGGASRRVLVIEDNEDIADSLQVLLELEGHVVHVAYEGAAGVAAARAMRPEVVVCDIGLPEMDGYDVARALRRDPATQSAYLIALSGYARPEDRERALQAGFDAHLAKPPKPDALEALLASAGERRAGPD